MIAWSNAKLRFTSGIGCLAFAGLFGEMYGKDIPPWMVIGVTMAPILIFLFIQPGEMPAGFVRVSQVIASLWYFSTAIFLIGQTVLRQSLPRGFLLYFVFMLAGAVPCTVVLLRIIIASSSGEDSNLRE